MSKLGRVAVLGGQMSYPTLTSKLDEKKYAISKVHLWLHMLNDNMKPKKWLKANTRGTKVNFDSIQSQADYDKGLIDLQVFVDEVNAMHGTEIKLRREEGESDA